MIIAWRQSAFYSAGDAALIAIWGANGRSIGVKLLWARGSGPAARCRGRPAIIALDAENAARAGIRIEKEHAAIGRQPFETIMRFALGTGIGTLHIGEAAGTFAPDAIEDFVQRPDLAGLDALTGAIRLCLSGG